MSMFRRLFYVILMNILILLVISVIGGIVIRVFGIKGQWGVYLVFYSLLGFGAAFISPYDVEMDSYQDDGSESY